MICPFWICALSSGHPLHLGSDLWVGDEVFLAIVFLPLCKAGYYYGDGTAVWQEVVPTCDFLKWHRSYHRYEYSIHLFAVFNLHWQLHAVCVLLLQPSAAASTAAFHWWLW